MSKITRQIFCCACVSKVEVYLTDGSDVYPHRPDLWELPFWKCPTCGNFVGCHHKTNDKTNPLGNIPTPEIRNARKHIHRILDPVWKSGHMSRREIYAEISNRIEREYHTAKIRSIEEARKIYRIVLDLLKGGSA